MSTTLYRKHRPQIFGELVDQEHVKQTLQNQIIREHVAHAYLFAGARGLGKTTTARILAKSLNCLKRKSDKAEPCNKCANCEAVNEQHLLDLIEVDAASNRGINEIRELKEHVGFAPAGAKYRIFIIDEAHMLTTEACNALLKTLEEPPAHVVFILATTQAHRLPETVRSRCQQFTFRRVCVKDVSKRLERIAKLESVALSREVIERIAQLSQGYMRDAISLLGQIVALRPTTSGSKVSSAAITLEEAEAVLPVSHVSEVEALVNYISIHDLGAAMVLVGELTESGVDITYFRRELIEFLRHVMLSQFEPSLAAADMAEWAGKFSKTELLLLLGLLLKDQDYVSDGGIPELPLELALLEYHVRTSHTDAVPEAATKTMTQAASQEAATEVAKVLDIRKEQIDQLDSAPADLELEDLTLEVVRKRWREVVVTSKKYNHSMPFILKIAHPLAVDGATIELGFEYDFHLERLSDKKNRELAAKVLTEVFKRNLKVAGIKLDTDRAKQVRASRLEGFAEDKSLLDNMLSVFGGQVVE